MPASFGVIVACHRGDYALARACCASVRQHLGDIAIGLLADGDFSTRDLENVYGVTTIRSRDVAQDVLRNRSYGYGLTKMVAFWASPFERFLYLDADTIVWGDVLAGLDVESADFIFNSPHEAYTDFILKSQYFDFDRLFEHIETFEWQGLPYFNTGVFIARRHLFAIDEYVGFLDLQAREAQLLQAGDQGILNIMTFRAAEQRRITVRQWPLQTVVPVVPIDELRRRFRIEDGEPQVSASDRTVIHWAGSKPFSLHRRVFRAPMAHYRRRAQRERADPLRVFGGVSLLLEEFRTAPRTALPPGWRVFLREARRRMTGRGRPEVEGRPR